MSLIFLFSSISFSGQRLEIGFPIHIDTISMALNYDVFLSMRVVLILANSADPDEMQHYAAFHLGLHCLSKFQYKANKKNHMNNQTFAYWNTMKYCHSDTV